ncbi:putative C-type lectin domain family 20 member A [Eucyclogobius newberryi]|uniref:putative C-type lectin domain family 20 member A n=1 Tax=Eucyclogobius newberryi TaxID=166745 RepID=UPI003B5BD9DA
MLLLGGPSVRWGDVEGVVDVGVVPCVCRESLTDSRLVLDMDEKVLLIFLLYGAGVVQSFHTVKYEYYFINSAMQWNAARQYCREHYTDLATFRNMDDISKVTRPSSYSYAWIGLFDDPASWQGFMTNDSNSWRWSATGAPSPSRYMKWNTGQPNFGGYRETCAYVYAGRWFDYPCTHRLYFVCFNGTNDSSSKQFFPILTLKSWEDARSYCREHYTDLAMIEDETENTAVASLQWSSPSWIGLHREPWRWSDGSTSTFQNWALGQPSSGVENCVVESSVQTWHDAWCANSYPFICEKAVKTKFTRIHLKLQTGADLSDPANRAQILAQARL